MTAEVLTLCLYLGYTQAMCDHPRHYMQSFGELIWWHLVPIGPDLEPCKGQLHIMTRADEDFDKPFALRVYACVATPTS